MENSATYWQNRVRYRYLIYMRDTMLFTLVTHGRELSRCILWNNGCVGFWCYIYEIPFHYQLLVRENQSALRCDEYVCNGIFDEYFAYYSVVELQFPSYTIQVWQFRAIAPGIGVSKKCVFMPHCAGSLQSNINSSDIPHPHFQYHPSSRQLYPSPCYYSSSP